jgi:hypothetical protein
MRSWDNGNSWQWSCAEAYAGDSTTAQYNPMVITNSGRIFVGAGSEGLFRSDDFCDWKTVTSFGSAFVADVSPLGSELLVLTSTYGFGDGGYETLLWKSTGEGEAWTRVGTALPTTLLGSQARTAPSDPRRFYVVGIEPDGTVGHFMRSDDEATTWTRHEFPLDPAKQSGAFLRLPVVHPTRPGVAFVRIDMSEGSGQNSPDSILGTKDGGVTWTTLFESTGDIPGVALSPDGKTLLVAGPLEGIHGADVDAALTNGRAAFERIFDGQVWGLAWLADGTLYAGHNNFGSSEVPEITLGVSHDGGRTFEKVMNVCQIEFPGPCQPSSTVGGKCEEGWTGESGFVDDFFVKSGRCVSPGDGGNRASGAAEGDCACSAPGRHGGGLAALAFVAFSFVAARFRRGHRRAGSSPR